jgi:ArsR family transcriptional regulator
MLDKKKAIITTLKNCASIGIAPEAHYDRLQILAQDFKADIHISKILTILNALGNHDRFLILNLLQTKDRCVCELEAALAKSQPAVSRDLKILESAQLIRGWKHGKFTHYSLVQKNFEFFSKFCHEWTANITNWFGSV